MEITENYAKKPIAKINKHNRIKLHSPSLQSIVKTVFFPVGYPNSVSPDYINYQLYDTFQAFFSSLAGILATRGMLKGFGVGDDSSTLYSAVLTWMLRDGLSMLSRILFAYSAGTLLQSDVKTWRFTADIFNDLGLLCEIISVTLPKEYFIVLSSIGMVFKTCTGVCGGATKMALTYHFAINENTADLDAKDGSQETIVNLLGMLAGALMMQLLFQDCKMLQGQTEICEQYQMYQTWVLLGIFIPLHLLFNYLAVKSVVLKSINKQRGEILISYFVNDRTILSFNEVATNEHLLKPLIGYNSIKLGCSIRQEDFHRISKEVDKSIHIFPGLCNSH
ncbi:vitamin B6 photo-protection and homoeostasis-domain-containing protein [Globomyces pollinis-pini]|nr:vitamin B6 photo-protection and homoeostasis-domain-containing protein [Globomyces pollinis-pini]